MNDDVADPGSTGRALRANDGVSVREILRFIWRSRWFALVAGVAGCLAAATAAWLVTPAYKASVELLPVARGGQRLSLGSLGSAVSGLGGLASLAGLNLNGGGGMKAEAIATLQSQVLTDTYVQEHDLLPVLFPKKWDAATKSWKSHNPRKIPTLWKANRLFKHKIRGVDEDPKTGLVTLTITWRNPEQAAQWANGLVKLTNDYLQQKAINEALRNIAYLKQQIATTNTVEVKGALYELMEEEIKKEMVAKGRRDYALNVVDPAVPPELKSFPKPVLWTVGGALAGVFLGLLAALVRETVVEGERDTMDGTRSVDRTAGSLAVPASSSTRSS